MQAVWFHQNRSKRCDFFKTWKFLEKSVFWCAPDSVISVFQKNENPPFTPNIFHQNTKQIRKQHILMSSTQYDLTFHVFLFFLKNAAVPSVCDERYQYFSGFSKFFTQKLEQIWKISDFDELWTVWFHVSCSIYFYQERRCSLCLR